MTVQQQTAEPESMGSVWPGSRGHLWAAYETAVGDWERACATERAFYAAYEFAADGWRQKREEESVAFRRTREAFEAWQRATDGEPTEQDRREVS